MKLKRGILQALILQELYDDLVDIEEKLERKQYERAMNSVIVLKAEVYRLCRESERVFDEGEDV